MRTFGNAIILIAVLNLFMLLGLGGYLAGTGRLDKQKFGTIVDMVKHQGTPEHLRDDVYEIMHPAAATGPATAPTTMRSLEHGSMMTGIATATDRIEYTRQAIELERLRMDRESQDLRNRQNLLDSERASVDAKLAQIEKEKKEFQDKVAKSEATLKDENFAKTLDLYNQLKPKQVKEIFLTLPAPVVESYLRAMDQDRAGKVIAEFKSPDDRQFIAGVLEQIRRSGTSSATTQPGSTIPS